MRTAESVAIGHPDKMCDQISDAILDEALRRDPRVRVAMETMGGHGSIYVVGEMTTKEQMTDDEITKIILDVLTSCGEQKPNHISINIVQQSPQIAQGVDTGGAGDQGIMVGYATSETPEFMPKEVILARKLTQLMGARDGKSQVTLDDYGKVETVVTSVCGITEELKRSLEREIQLMGAKKWLLNPAGEWTVGGFTADTGLTGRKIIVDAYGPRIPIGGGAFSGKDATKVDRSAAYMARRIAVDYLKALGAREVWVDLAYAIGVSQPVMATATVDGVQKRVEGYNLTPEGIIDYLSLRNPIYKQTASHGHFGRNFTWDI